MNVYANSNFYGTKQINYRSRKNLISRNDRFALDIRYYYKYVRMYFIIDILYFRV